MEAHQPRHPVDLERDVDAVVRTVAAEHYRPNGPLAYDDLVQIGRLAAQGAAATHDGRSFGRVAYIRRAVTWKLRDAYRHELLDPQPSHSPELFDAALAQHPRRDFANEAVRRLDVARAMRQLRPDYRQVLFELQVLDRPWHEVAQARGISLNALKSLHQRALSQLRLLDAA
jgi:RNA polymerase sigma factor (sigma-70 family)